MTQRYGDMVQETISAPGTAAFTLGTPSTGFVAFSTIPSIASGDTVDYLAVDASGTPWEVGTGTWTSGTLTRTTVLHNSSGGTTAVNFTGSTLVSNTLTAERYMAGLGGGTVNSGTSGQVAYYASNGTAVSGEAPGALNVIATGSSTSRTLATRFAEGADVYDYGAAGNGTTDDSTAFNAAVATGKPVFMPPGSYKLVAGELSGYPSMVAGYSVNLPTNGFTGVTNQSYWNGKSGAYFAKNLTDTNGQATVVINATNNQSSNSGESAGLYVSTINYGTSVTGLAGIFQASAGASNTSASLCSINAYSLWGSGTQGSGSVSEMDVYNNTGTDDSWPISNTTAKSGLFLVSDGANKPSYALGVAASGAAFQAGAVFFNGATAQYDLYGAGASTTPRWYVDISGNITGQTIYGQTLEVGTFSAAYAATISTGAVAPTASAKPGSLYLDGNQSLPGPGQLWVNTSTGTGTQWGQVPTLNTAAVFTVSVQAPILGGAHNVLDDGAGDATIAGSLFAKSGVDFVGSSSGGTTLVAPSTGTTMTLALPGALPSAGQVLTASSVSGSTVTGGWSTVGGSGTVTSVAVSGGTTGLTTSGGPITGSGTITLAGTLAVANGGTGGTTSTGSGAVVLATSPTLVTPALGTPSSATLTNATGLPVGGISATGTPSSTTYLRGDGSWSTPAGSGGGSGTVNSGTAGQIAYYASAGTAVSGVQGSLMLPMQSGRWYTHDYVGFGAGGGAGANKISAHPLVVRNPISITKFAVMLDAASPASSDTLVFGIYSGSINAPTGATLLGSASVAVPASTAANTVVSATLGTAVTLMPGEYFLAINQQTSISLYGGYGENFSHIGFSSTSNIAAEVSNFFNNSAPYAISVSYTYTGSLPSTFPSGSSINSGSGSAIAPAIWVLVQ